MDVVTFTDILRRAFDNMSSCEIESFFEPFEVEGVGMERIEEVFKKYGERVEGDGEMSILDQLDKKGWCIVEGVLSEEEVEEARTQFFEWFDSIPDFYNIHKQVDPHFIFKFHEVGHQLFAWFIRCNKNVQRVFSEIWGSDDLIVSFDGACYFREGTKTSSKSKSSVWTHTDQAPSKRHRICVQGFVALTTNVSNSLVVYEGSHLLFGEYFKSRNLDKSSSRWNKIDLEYLDGIQESRRVLNVKKGSLVLWDSRLFHQNQIVDDEEERLVQYVCYLPRSSSENTESNRKKRMKYFEERRTTSHWPCPLKVNGKQPQTYGNDSLLINYDSLVEPDLSKYSVEINKLL